MGEDVEHDCNVDDRDGESLCPICRGDPLDPQFVDFIKRAAAQPGRRMTFDEAMRWLRDL